MPSSQVDDVPDDGAGQAAKISRSSTMALVDDAAADGIGDMQAEQGEGDEIEEGRPEHGVLRPQHAGRDDGRDGIGGVVQAVQEIEQQRDGDERDEKEGDAVHAQTLHMFEQNAADPIGDVLEAIDNLFQMAE